MNDVYIEFHGDASDSVRAAEELAAVLETIRALAVQVTEALGEIRIGPSVVSRFLADTAAMRAGLAGLEGQANDTRRALAGIGVGSLLAGGGVTNIDRRVTQNLVTNQYASSRGESGGAGAGALAALGWSGGRGGRGGFGWGPAGWMLGGLMGGFPHAGFGTPLALAGLGAERMLGTSLGILGSLSGGLLGGGLYAGGLLGTSAVGMGTDLAGIGQAAGDIRKTTQAYDQLQQAIALYGRNSRQAREAQAQLNYTLSGFPAVARAAVMQATLTGQQFKAMFDRFTGPAEKTGAQVINQGMQVGESFLPTIGKYATENMKIIQKGLQPLFTWTQSPGGGLGIFTQLEQLFQNRLPTAVHAGTQGIELFSHAILDAANRTGGFLPKLDAFLTKLNTNAGLKEMDAEIGHLMDLFHVWLDLGTSLVKVVFDLFKPAVGLGKDFAEQLTRIVNLTRNWVNAAGTQNVLHNLFEAHKEQLNAIFDVLRALGPILGQTVTAFAQVETVVAKLTVGPLKVLADLIGAINKIPFADKIIGWGLALGVVFFAVGKLETALLLLRTKFLASVIAPMVAGFERLIGFLTGSAGLTAAEATTETETAAMATGMRASFASLLGPIALAIAAVYALDKAIKALTGFDALKKAWGSAGWGADNAAADTFHGKNPYPVGTSEHESWQAGHSHHRPKGVSNAGWKAMQQSAAYKAGARAKSDPSGGTNTSQGGYANPVPGQSSFARVDQGVDYSVNGSVAAIASGTIISVGSGMNGGSGAIIKQRFDKPVYVNGRTYYGAYYSEGKPLVEKGDHVKAGEPVMGGGGVELGFLLGRDLLFPPLKGGLGAGTKPGQSGYDFEQFAGGLGAPMGGGLPPSATYTSAAARAAAAAAGHTRVPHGRGGAGATDPSLPISLQLAIDKAATTKGTSDDLKALDAAVAWVEEKIKKLKAAHASLKTLDAYYQMLGGLQGQVSSLQASSTSRASDLSAGHSALKNIAQALHGSLLGHQANLPSDIMGVHSVATAHATWDPKLEGWRKQILAFDKELRDKTISQQTADTIRSRIDGITKHITAALTALKDAAQTQLQAAQTAWSSFMAAFDQSYSSSSSDSSGQLDAARTQLGKDQLAVSLDSAQSGILGGTADTSMAQKVIDDMKTVLAGTGGTKQPYTQQQIDNWLGLWGDYYASQGYTPQQMYDAFNKLLASVGLPTIDNPFDTGGLPLPPGTSDPSSPTRGPSIGSQWTGGGGGIGGKWKGGSGGIGSAWNGKIVPQHSVTRQPSVTETATHPATEKQPVNVEIRLEKGLEWLDKHVVVIVDGEIKKHGEKANTRARSGRF